MPSALTPRTRVVRPTTPTGIDAVDALLEGGLPLGALTEIVGPESSGRTSLGLSSIAQLTAAGKVCAWVDVSDMLKPECAAAAGIALPYLLWVRCGSEGLSDAEWDKEVEHSVRIARTVLSHLTTRHPELFRSREAPWYVATGEDVPQ